MRKMLYVKLGPKALEALILRANRNRRTPQAEAGVLVEHALGVREDDPQDEEDDRPV